MAKSPSDERSRASTEAQSGGGQARFISLKSAAARTNLSVSTLRRAREQGDLPSYKPQGKVLFDVDELDGWIKAGRSKKRDGGQGRPRGNRSQRSGSLREEVMRRRGR